FSDDSHLEHRQLFLPACLVMLSIMVLGISLNKLLGEMCVPSPLDRAVARAVDSLKPGPKGDRRKTEPVEMPDGSVTSIPLEQSIDSQKTIELALDLENRRQRCLTLLARMQPPPGGTNSNRPVSVDSDEFPELKELWETTQGNVADMLHINRQQARIVLYALSWPPLRTLSQQGDANLPQPHTDLLDQARHINTSNKEQILRLIRTSRDRPWMSIAERLVDTWDLEQGELKVLQGYQCRQKVSRAFRSSRDAAKAKQMLQKHAALTSTQTRQVLALRAVQCLLEAGPDVFPPLIQFARNNRRTGTLLLHHAVAVNGIRRQAAEVVQHFIHEPDNKTSKKLLAFGPFALEAINNLPSELSDKMGPEHWNAVSKLKNQWSNENNALDILGDDADQWKRWYEQAHSML
ncbi:MAG: hypothetical protein ACOC0A_03655, partial [Planctomycetota bacterium]